MEKFVNYYITNVRCDAVRWGGRERQLTRHGVISCINFNFKTPESSSHRAKSIDNLRLFTIRKDNIVFVPFLQMF